MVNLFEKSVQKTEELKCCCITLFSMEVGPTHTKWTTKGRLYQQQDHHFYSLLWLEVTEKKRKHVTTWLNGKLKWQSHRTLPCMRKGNTAPVLLSFLLFQLLLSPKKTGLMSFTVTLTLTWHVEMDNLLLSLSCLCHYRLCPLLFPFHKHMYELLSLLSTEVSWRQNKIKHFRYTGQAFYPESVVILWISFRKANIKTPHSLFLFCLDQLENIRNSSELASEWF